MTLALPHRPQGRAPTKASQSGNKLPQNPDWLSLIGNHIF
jgi:hypothetical protein